MFFAWEPTLKERSFFTSKSWNLVPTCPYNIFSRAIIPFMVPYTCLVGAFCANMAYQSISSFVRLVLLASFLDPQGVLWGSFSLIFSESPNLWNLQEFISLRATVPPHPAPDAKFCSSSALPGTTSWHLWHPMTCSATCTADVSYLLWSSLWKEPARYP